MSLRAAGFVPVVLLAGCAGHPALPPPSPTTTQIASRGAEYASVSLDPATYLMIGTQMVRDSCAGYFDALIQTNDKLATAGSGVSLLGGAASGALVAAGAGPGAVAGAAIGAMLAHGAIDAARDSSGAGAFPAETAGLILDRAMPSYQVALTPPATVAEADADVHGMAALCSSNKIHQLIRSSIATAQTAALAPPQAAAALSFGMTATEPETPLPAPKRRRHAVQPPSIPDPPAPMPRAYPSSLLQHQWLDVQSHGRAAVENRVPLGPPIVVVARP